MQNLDPFTRKTIQYHRAYKDSTDNGGGRSSDSVASPSPKEVDEEDVYLLAQPRHRPRLRHLCGYFFVALISLVLGLTLSQVFRVEYEVDGYTGTFLLLQPLVTNQTASTIRVPSPHPR
jgi:hypothetical protein